MPQIRIQCVVVLYQCAIQNSRTLQTLSESYQRHPDIAVQVAILIYDNSPHPQDISGLSSIYRTVLYVHAPENGGLAAAYNHALVVAKQSDAEWLLLLDQDTHLRSELLTSLLLAIGSSSTVKPCAIVPKLIQDGEVISPQVIGRFHNHNLPATFSGIVKDRITAFNSAACLRIDAVTALGGFPKDYWLDYLDHVMFYRLQSEGGQILILNVTLEHRLSLRNLEAEMSLTRYANVLAAEWSFVRETGTGGGVLAHRLRLLKRTVSHIMKIRNGAYALTTMHAAFKSFN